MKFLPLLLLAALLVGAPATAFTITGAGDSHSTTLGGNVGGNAVPGLTASVMISVVSFTGSSAVLDITLQNTSDSNIWQSARLSAFGFDSSAPLSGGSSSGLFSSAVLGGAFPNGFGGVDICATNNPNACQGGGNGGLQIGQSGTIQMTLNFASPVNSVDISNLGVRWQSLDSRRLGIRGGSGTGGVSNPIPEPSAALAFGIGLAIVTAGRRRK